MYGIKMTEFYFCTIRLASEFCADEGHEVLKDLQEV